MKTTWAVFALAVFLISLAQPAFAAGCGSNGSRSAPTTATATAPRTTTAQPAGGASGAGMPR